MGARYMECSSKENIGVEEIFDTAITMAVKAGEEAEFDNRLNASDSSRGGSGLSGKSSEKRRRKKNKGCKFL
jgi:Ras family protein A